MPSHRSTWIGSAGENRSPLRVTPGGILTWQTTSATCFPRAARLHHINIVPVFEIGHVSGYHFYTMQFIQGHGLHDVIKELVRLRGSKAECTAQPAGSIPRDRPATESLTNRYALTATLARHLLSGRFRAADALGSDSQHPVDVPSVMEERDSDCATVPLRCTPPANLEHIEAIEHTAVGACSSEPIGQIQGMSS